MCYHSLMHTVSYHRHRFPPDIIQNAVWLYFRFPLSFRDVEDLLAERGIDVSYETVRRWSVKFGLAYARKLRRSHPPADTRWHLDEVFVSINGRSMYLWRAVDCEGEVLDVLVQSRRNKRAALKLMRKLLKTQGFVPAAIVTDNLPSHKTLRITPAIAAGITDRLWTVEEIVGLMDEVAPKPGPRGTYRKRTPVT